MVAAEPQNTSERAQTALANFVVMTVSSDALFSSSLFAPCSNVISKRGTNMGVRISFPIDADVFAGFEHTKSLSDFDFRSVRHVVPDDVSGRQGP